MHLVVYESSSWADLAPFTLTRPAALLRCGMTTLLQKLQRSIRFDRLTLWVRPVMADVVRREVKLIPGAVGVNEPLGDEPVLLVDGASLLSVPFFPAEAYAGSWSMHDTAGDLLAARTTAPGMTSSDALEHSPRWQSIAELPAREPLLRRVRHWGDLVSANSAALLDDWNAAGPHRRPSATCINADAVHAGDAKIAPGVVLDATNGPIFIADHAIIGANSVLEGPCYVGLHTRITPLSLIRGGTSIGPYCRVGGEVSGTIFQGYSNKSHDGFLGDSFVGEWVNCGAGTTTSNLKSTYGPVKATVGTRQLDSGRTLLGAAIGDHAKLATYTMLAAGGYVGVGSMLALSTRVGRLTPSFRFITDEQDVPLDLQKAAQIAARMHQRRSRTFDSVEQAVLDYAAAAAGEIEKTAAFSPTK